MVDEKDLQHIVQTLIEQNKFDIDERVCKEDNKEFTHGYNVGYAAAVYQLSIMLPGLDFETKDLAKKNFFFGNQLPTNIVRNK